MHWAGVAAAAALVSPALAVEPVSGITVGTITTVVGFIVSAISIILDAIRYAITYSIFFLILIVIGVQFIGALQRLDIVAILERLIGNAVNCAPAGPRRGDPDTLPRQQRD